MMSVGARRHQWAVFPPFTVHASAPAKLKSSSRLATLNTVVESNAPDTKRNTAPPVALSKRCRPGGEPPKFCGVAQLVEHGTVNAAVAGSTPATTAKQQGSAKEKTGRNASDSPLQILPTFAPSRVTMRRHFALSVAASTERGLPCHG